MADADRVMKAAPKRATGEIPLSWALPAESVSEAQAPKTSSRTGLVAAGVVVLIVVGAVLALSQRSTPSTPSTPSAPSTTSTTSTSPAQPALVPAPVAPAPVAGGDVVAPPLPVATPAASAAVDVPAPASATPAVSREARDQAQSLIGRARVAARDGNDAKARELAEQAVTLDPDCGGCWRTVAFLRGRAGDRPAAALARARALAVEQHEQGTAPVHHSQ